MSRTAWDGQTDRCPSSSTWAGRLLAYRFDATGRKLLVTCPGCGRELVVRDGRIRPHRRTVATDRQAGWR